MTKMRNEYEDYSPFFVKPHTLASLGLLVCTIFLISNTDVLFDQAAAAESDPRDIVPSPVTFNALKGVAVMFLGVGAIHLPNTIMTRPISFLWRVLLATFIMYIAFMTFLYMLPVSHARMFLTVFDSNLGKPLPERSYADDCRVYTPENPESQFANISGAVWDCHFLAHFAGWWGKMLFMRDWYIAWICSIMFEICEITFRHWLPNFYECWWDHLFLDLFGCNLIGIILGHFTLKYYGIPKIKWVLGSVKEEKKEGCATNKLKSLVEKIKPDILEHYQWSALKDTNRLFGVTAFIVVCLVADCNNFFMKFLLWVPPEHVLLQFRVVLIGLCAIPTAKEWYEFISNEHCHRLGPFAWCMIFNACIETLIVIKFQGNAFVAPFPMHVKIIWSVIGAVYTGLFVQAATNQMRATKLNENEPTYNPYNPQITTEEH